jgi:hypothetical protein
MDVRDRYASVRLEEERRREEIRGRRKENGRAIIL